MKLYYVYYAIDKDGKVKVGCTSQPQRRLNLYQESKLLYCFTDPIKAGDKEIELQIKYFGKRDNSKHYAHFMEVRKQKKSIEGFRKGGRTTVKLIQSLGKHIHKGEEAGGSKLKNNQVKFIRKNWTRSNTVGIKENHNKLSTRELMYKFGVSKHTISLIVHNKIWTHI
tara:strand:- start:132 stop:635 length:504 start_codon:yes stop_codon:yes gene_type:complete